jgi:hypothetical protein
MSEFFFLARCHHYRREKTELTVFIFTFLEQNFSKIRFHVGPLFNPLTPELNPSAQRLLTRFCTGGFAS